MANASLRGRNVLTTIIPKVRRIAHHELIGFKKLKILHYLQRYSSNAKAAPQQSAEQVQRLMLKKEDVQITKLPNGIVVASIETNNPITRLSAVVNVGARNEDYDSLGATHVIRSGCNLVS